MTTLFRMLFAFCPYFSYLFVGETFHANEGIMGFAHAN